jgi:hypothetical protein
MVISLTHQVSEGLIVDVGAGSQAFAYAGDVFGAAVLAELALAFEAIDRNGDAISANPRIWMAGLSLLLLFGQWLRQRISAALFKRCFFIGLGLLGAHLMING